MRAKPFVHIFKTSDCFYLYDVNKDQIIRISDEAAKALKRHGGAQSSEITSLREHGFLDSNRVSETEHPATKLLPYHLKNKMTQLILQVTQSCNLRCSYCAYSGGYENRTHTQKQMSFDIARKAMDYFSKHTKDTKKVTISFYGGEPLLRMDFVKKCMEYAKNLFHGKTVLFNMTTNGTLFTDEWMDFFANEKIHTMISLDGPEKIHDRNRRFAGTNEGSYQTILHNIRALKQSHPDYFNEYVIYNAVMDTEDGFRQISDFVMDNEEFRNNYFGTTTISQRYTDEEVVVSDHFREEWGYEEFKLLLSKMGRLRPDAVSNIMKVPFNDMCRKCLGKKTTSQSKLPHKWHHSGPCMPGVLRLFVSAEGGLFPCERVSEHSCIAKIGDVETGVNHEAASRILNIEKASSGKCRNCWAYRYCSVCIGAVDGLDQIDSTLADMECGQVRSTLEDAFANYCTLIERGYDFGEERLRNILTQTL